MAAETAYAGVLHRKARGSLALSDRGLAFRPDASNAAPAAARVVLPWDKVAKHQVSPATHPKSLLKVVASGPGGKAASYTFLFPERRSLEGARRDVSARLSKGKKGKKRPRDDASVASNAVKPTSHKRQSTPPSSRFINLDPVALVATRAALLASDPALRAQHRLLVLDGGTLSEEDFWETHSRLVADEYAKISGKAHKGTSSDIKSSLDLGISTTAKKDAKKAGSGGVVHLGVEEMRQIFLMYPAVHKAYEEKVPLELSEEQFWRKYLESEYFHRDRGRIGAHIGKVNERELREQERMFGKRDEEEKEGKKKKDGEKEDEPMGEEEAQTRLAAAGTEDIFSRYDPRSRPGGGKQRASRKLGTQIAVGQFDLASTHEVERGDRFLELRDLHPPPDGDSAGARVIDKFNRHALLLMHPRESTAGVDLGRVAAKSARAEAAAKTDEDDAKVNGGYDEEMRRLIGFADADENDADCARGAGDSDDLLELHLRNVDAYTGQFGNDPAASKGGESELQFARLLAATTRADAEPILKSATAGMSKGFCTAPTLKSPLPAPKIGRGLLEALTKKMAADSQTEADVQKLAEELGEEFKAKLAKYFRRASELLRHFFSLRSVFNENADGNGGVGQSAAQKDRLTSIVKGMEKVHGEMYELTRNLPLMESKMFKPIMDQLDKAFQLHKDDSSRGKGGFVTVGGFVPVEH
ncbi:hypothetical protein ACHAXT_009319 [Thalassiosira profunda]